MRGPNVMNGCRSLTPTRNSLASTAGDDTGDIVSVDADGYRHISRTAETFPQKVSGEMVESFRSGGRVGSALSACGLRCEVAVITRPDENKGEALIAVTNEPKLSPEETAPPSRPRG